ncbi:MAG: O-antigen ligase family protein [Bacteroidales bacterium]|nr:O-antigen ligase family protein [Bacteroidales bacterium]
MKPELRDKLILWASVGIFILINLFCIWKKEFFYFPASVLVIGVLYLLVYRVDWLMYIMAFVTPLSVELNNEKFQLGISLPSEFIMISLTLLFLCKILYDLKMDKRLALHPVTIAVYAYLLWMFMTCITSARPVVSFKFWASKLWFITSCYFMVIQLIKDDLKNAVKFFDSYTVGLVIVVIYTTIHHAIMGFTEHSGHWVMSPFYNDHTAYGAVLAFFIPIVAALFFQAENKGKKWFYAVCEVLLLGGLYLSFCRAAWISVIVMLAVWMVMKLKIKFSWIVITAMVFGALFYFYSDDILYRMGRNSQDTSGNLVEHIQSMSNITTDASNVERLNRWTAAFGMIKERPVLGWGPGTYQFEYAPFQKSEYQTIISTDFGDGGNAHSEYLGPCAETGIVGLLTVLALLVTSLYSGIHAYSRATDRLSRSLALCMTLALVGYFIHGFLNNFLDTDKLSLPFWAAFAVIAVVSRNARLCTSATCDCETQSLT